MKKKLLVLGQTPPPYHGQAVAIKNFIDGNFETLQIFHLKMDFSTDIDSVGKFKIKKIFKLFAIILKAYYLKFRYNIKNLYYPPAGGNLVPIIRDILLLIAIRPLFKTTIFHFHSGGLTKYYTNLSSSLKKLYKIAYQKPDMGILVTSHSDIDLDFLQCKKTSIIHNGVLVNTNTSRQTFSCKDIQILYVGSLRESKGILVLLDLCKNLLQEKIDFHFNFVGEFHDENFKQIVINKITEFNLINNITLHGLQVGEKKEQQYTNADIFCFPTFYEQENLPLAVIEAMSHSLPVVATNWRGIPDLIEDNINGFLVPVKDSNSYSEKISKLIKSKDLRFEFGIKGNQKFKEKFSIEQYRKSLEESLYRVSL